MNTPIVAAIGMGANLGHPAQTLSQAAQALQAISAKPIVMSRIYRSAPIGPAGQPDYANAVALIHTLQTPLDLLDQLQAIEQQFGRTRSIRWGARSLDLDLLLYGEQQIQHERLTVPHIELLNRNFVLWPLAEVMPSIIFSDGITIKAHCQQIGREGLSLWLDSSQLDPKPDDEDHQPPLR
ncbi:MAG: 2-amino-4-hydroxy-6-hydroxymethyldihydropteridine diphosphokinase [Moraxellaceae bacterium]|nr:2-amino-4-hydroxy-6-hydroxymethyldihydropteridine diphosphokinase [Moraxellaceae bacterium]MDZ4387472.1 2-amino-4-hydroxy-6-hydroxymethyldihydropteridine diphosphokinase [Moraxellaceae bacterium]